MRAFWPMAFLNLFSATVFALSALWVTFNPASGCTVDGQSCNSFSAGTLALYIGGPTLALVLTVVFATWLRRNHPVAALALVASPLLLLIAMVFANRG